MLRDRVHCYTRTRYESIRGCLISDGEYGVCYSRDLHIYVEKRVVKMRRHGDREIPGVDSWTSSFNGASLVVIMYLYYQQGRISNKGSSSRNSSIGYGSMLGTITYKFDSAC